MSKRKRKADIAAPAQPELRKYPEWPVEQVMEVMLKLYALEPFKINSKAAYFHWNGLVEEAFDFLDKSYKFCEELARERSLWNAECRSHEPEAAKEAAEAAKLPDLVSFEKAMRFITGRGRTKLATQNFNKFVRYNRLYSGKRPDQLAAIARGERSLSWCGLTFRTLNRQIARWRKTGVPHSCVVCLRKNFKDSWEEIVAKENSAKAKKRKQWPDDRIRSALPKLRLPPSF